MVLHLPHCRGAVPDFALVVVIAGGLASAALHLAQDAISMTDEYLGLQTFCGTVDHVDS